MASFVRLLPFDCVFCKVATKKKGFNGKYFVPSLLLLQNKAKVPTTVRLHSSMHKSSALLGRQLGELVDVYVINLLTRDDRLKHIRDQLEQLSLASCARIQRFHRHPTDPGMGVQESLNACLHHAIEQQDSLKQQRPILVLEDDAKALECNLWMLEHVINFIKDHHRNCQEGAWDTIRLGYSKPIYHRSLQTLTPEAAAAVDTTHCLYWGNCAATTAVIYSRHFAGQLHRYLSSHDNIKPGSQLDHVLAKMTPRNVLTADNLFTQARSLPSDNIWWSALDRQAAFMKDPETYIDRHIRISQFYRDNLVAKTLLPRRLVYLWLMLRFHGLNRRNIWYNYQ